MATIPIHNPSVPFLGLIPGGLRPGLMIRIKGCIPTYGNRCQINIQSGAALEPRDDVPLHVSIRPAEQAIVRNHLVKQQWGNEERHAGCPIHYGVPFEMLILGEASVYKIAINGAHFCTFVHRLPMSQVQYVSIGGDCTISFIGVEGDTNRPPGYTPTAPPIGLCPPPPPPPPPYTPPLYPNMHHHHHPPHHPHHHHQHHGGYPTKPGYPSRPPYPTTTARPGYPGFPSGAQPTPYTTAGVPAQVAYVAQEKKKNNKLKYAAAGLGVGALGGFALSQAFGGSDSD